MLAGPQGKLTAATVVSLLLVVAMDASADGWPYVGASGGYSFIDVSENNISVGAVNSGFASAQTSIDDTDTGWKVFGGWRFNEYIALEGSYIDFGEAKFKTRTTGPDGVIDGKADGTAYAVDVIAIARPAEWADLFVKVGGFRWDVDAKQAEVVDGEASSVKNDETGTDVKAGIGASFMLSDSVAVRLEAEGYFNVGDKNRTGNADIGFLSIGLSYGF